FQAEDGIRDRTVTGVQTCALPICLYLRPRRAERRVDQPTQQRAFHKPDKRPLPGAAFLLGLGCEAPRVFPRRYARCPELEGRQEIGRASCRERGEGGGGGGGVNMR